MENLRYSRLESLRYKKSARLPDMTLHRTPLFARHTQLGGRMIEFGGWEMPVFYASIVEEHLAVRQAAGLFDISHMGHFHIGGPSAQDFLNQLLTNDVRKLKPGQGQYTLLCLETGGVVDDLYVFQLAEQDYWLIVNASRVTEDAAWTEAQRRSLFADDRVRFDNVSDRFGALAIQGPRVKEFINTVFPAQDRRHTSGASLTDLKKNQIAPDNSAGAGIWISRTGYTGEDGFEIIAPREALEALWDQLLAAGQTYGLRPIGLGARDTLRTEAGYPLYGHELDEQTTPLEAGLGRFVALDKPQFMGREALVQQQAQGIKKAAIAFKFTEKNAPPRPHYPIWSTGSQAVAMGIVTSGTQSPSLNTGIGLGFVPPAFTQPGTPITIEIRGRHAPAVVTAKPIYRKPTPL